jgi:hypothetical protein
MASSVITTYFKQQLLAGNIDLDGQTYRVALLRGTSGLNTSVFQTMTMFSAAQVYETTGTGYTAGGITLSGNVVGINGVNSYWDSIDVTWQNSTINADGAIVYRLVNNANNSPIVCFVDLYNVSPIGVKVSNNGNFTLQWNSLGILLCS